MAPPPSRRDAAHAAVHVTTATLYGRSSAAPAPDAHVRPEWHKGVAQTPLEECVRGLISLHNDKCSTFAFEMATDCDMRFEWSEAGDPVPCVLTDELRCMVNPAGCTVPWWLI